MARNNFRNLVFVGLGLIGVAVAQFAFADATTLTMGDVAIQATGSARGLAGLITAISMVVGMAFAVGAILKFKQHKDNPTQIPVGTPVALLFIAAGLLFLPTLFTTVGNTLFGKGASTAGISGSNSFVSAGGGGGT